MLPFFSVQFYSGTKALGEEVFEGARNCYILRLRSPFNEEKSPRNYLKKLLNYEYLLEDKDTVYHLGEFVQMCVEFFSKEIKLGIYNITNLASIT